MIFRSRTTKALSKVTEQNASSRSLFSSHSLMRTSVMTTAVLLQAGSTCRVRTTRTLDSGSPGGVPVREAAIHGFHERGKGKRRRLQPVEQRPAEGGGVAGAERGPGGGAIG